MKSNILAAVLAHPLSRGLDIDDPRTTEVRLQIIREKAFLRCIYDEWYRLIRARIPPGAGAVVELGSGAGYLREFVPEAIQTEVFFCRNTHVAADACSLPFPDAALKAITMTDVFHHIPKAELFLREATRCLRPGGRLVMVEPWVSSWSRLVYRHLHHEPFQPDALDWNIPAAGPLSGANGALPWIIFVRDRKRLAELFPSLEIEEVLPMMPFRYLVSGGISMRSLMPAAAYPLWTWLEKLISPKMSQLGMFAAFTLKRL
jgi:SAM-dependent methyltransferase